MLLKTDYIDIYQLHNPERLPSPDDPDGLYAALQEAQHKGMIRFIGVTNHRLDVARFAVRSGLYDTLQFPLNHLSSQAELDLIAACKEQQMGVIAMKALSGGLITNVPATFAFLRQYQNLVPIWGVQKESELDEFIALEANPPVLNEALQAAIEKDRAELSGNFCRGCGYCMPCPVGIQISMCARMSLLLRRAPYQQFLSEDWHNRMDTIESCTNCGSCKSKCPYGLNTPQLLKDMLADYRTFAIEHA